MIMFALLVGAVIAGTGILAKYWNNIKSWLQRAANKVAEVIRGVVYGVKVFAQKINEAFKEISRHYSKNKQGQWQETVVTREIDQSQVPPEILAMAQSQETDITEELQLQLS